MRTLKIIYCSFLLVIHTDVLWAGADIQAMTISRDHKLLVVADSDCNVTAYDFASGRKNWQIKLPSVEIIDLGIFPQRSKNFVVAVTREKDGPGLQLILWGKNVLLSRIFYGVMRAEELPQTTASCFIEQDQKLAIAESWGTAIYLLDVFTFTETDYARTLSISDILNSEMGVGSYVHSQRNPDRHPSSLGIYDTDNTSYDDPWVSIAGCESGVGLVGLTKEGYLYGWGAERIAETSSHMLPRWKPIFLRDLKATLDSSKRHGVSCSCSGKIATTVSSRKYGNIQIFDKAGLLVHFAHVQDTTNTLADLHQVEWDQDGRYLMVCSAKQYFALEVGVEKIYHFGTLIKQRQMKCDQRPIVSVGRAIFLLASGGGVWEYDASQRQMLRTIGNPLPLKESYR